MRRTARRDLLLVAADWRNRTLGLAGFGGGGYDVAAVPGMRLGAKALLSGLVAPAVILIDVLDDEDATPERVSDLLEAAPDVPAILVTGAYDRAAWEPLRPRVAALLHRP